MHSPMFQRSCRLRFFAAGEGFFRMAFLVLVVLGCVGGTLADPSIAVAEELEPSAPDGVDPEGPGSDGVDLERAGLGSRPSDENSFRLEAEGSVGASESDLPQQYLYRTPHADPRVYRPHPYGGMAEGDAPDGDVPHGEGHPGAGYRYDYPYYTPWFIPRTYGYKDALYPPPVAHHPRLGLMYNYPYSWQMGIRIPVDTDPLNLPDLPPYQGFVGAVKAALAAVEAEAEAEEAAAGAQGLDSAMVLMQAGRYREAGRLLAGLFERESSPTTALRLAEVLVALGRYESAELFLTHAFQLDGVEDVLPEGVERHFETVGEFRGHVARVRKSGRHSALAAYLLLRSGDNVQGVEVLHKGLRTSPADPLLIALLETEAP